MIVTWTSLDGLPHARGTGRPPREAILTRPLQVNERPARLPACITLREDLRHGPRRTRLSPDAPHAGRIWLWTACSAGRLRMLHWPERRLARSLLGWSGGGAGPAGCRAAGVLRVVVVALRKFDEGTSLIADSPGVMARGKEHHVPRREVLLRAVA